MKGINSELGFEHRIRDIIINDIISDNRDIIILNNQKTTDIMICRNGENSQVFFLEIKYYDSSHRRLGFGHAEGKGFQPEVLRKKPDFFMKNMRWVIGSKDSEEYFFVDNETILNYVSGGVIDYKYNNIQTKIFDEVSGLKIQELREQLINWIKE